MKLFLSFIVLFFISIYLLLPGCAKEYSYEYRPSAMPADTIKPPSTNPWICPSCIGNDRQIESKWSFHTDNFFYCGSIDTAIVNPERTGFTFYGPSSCSPDSGMVITVFMDGNILNKDMQNVSTNKAGFYYYDNVTPSYMLITRTGQPFSVTIDNYIHQTRLATGTFSGFVVRANGASSFINSGKFKVRFF